MSAHSSVASRIREMGPSLHRNPLPRGQPARGRQLQARRSLPDSVSHPGSSGRYRTRQVLHVREVVPATPSLWRLHYMDALVAASPRLKSMATLHLARGRLQATGMAEAQRKVARATRQTLNRSTVLCPVDTGRLRASGEMKVGRQGATVVGEVAYTAEYAAAVHNGRRALTIRPTRPGGKLRFVVNGRTIYASVVHQPARRARPFLTTALQEVAAREGFHYTQTMR